MHGPDRNEIEVSAEELQYHVQTSLDDTHRDLAWIRTALIAALFGALTVVNYFTLDETLRFEPTLFAILVVIAFVGMTLVHRFVNYPANRTNLMTLIEIVILQVDAVAFAIVTNNIMDGMGVYFLMIGAGIFMTTAAWVAGTVIALWLSWAAFFWVTSFSPDLTREILFFVSAVFGSFFFYYLRVRSTRRLGVLQLMELKYKDSLESAFAEIDTLSGLLPICASCKAIRSQGGDWTSIEQYMKARSDVEFTHSLCPTCHEKLYPDLPRP